jgi:hypothetical protein
LRCPEEPVAFVPARRFRKSPIRAIGGLIVHGDYLEGGQALGADGFKARIQGFHGIAARQKDGYGGAGHAWLRGSEPMEATNGKLLAPQFQP